MFIYNNINFFINQKTDQDTKSRILYWISKTNLSNFFNLLVIIGFCFRFNFKIFAFIFVVFFFGFFEFNFDVIR